MNKPKPPTMDEIQNDFQELEHEWKLQKTFDRPPTVEQMERAMKIAEDTITAFYDVEDD